MSGDVFDLRVGVATGMRWVEAKDAATRPAMRMSAPQQRIIQSQVSVVLRLRSPALEGAVDYARGAGLQWYRAPALQPEYLDLNLSSAVC